MTPPASLGILGQEVTIKYLPPAEMSDAYGLWYQQLRLIEVQDDMSPLDTRDTTLHEVMHAILAHQGRQYAGEVEETYVRALATGLTLVLRDNPKFAKWLITYPKP